MYEVYMISSTFMQCVIVTHQGHKTLTFLQLFALFDALSNTVYLSLNSYPFPSGMLGLSISVKIFLTIGIYILHDDRGKLLLFYAFVTTMVNYVSGWIMEELVLDSNP